LTNRATRFVTAQLSWNRNLAARRAVPRRTRIARPRSESDSGRLLWIEVASLSRRFYPSRCRINNVSDCRFRIRRNTANVDFAKNNGVLGPNAKLRSQIVPAPPERATETSSEGSHAQGAPPRMSWARLLKRVFDMDVEHCPNCGGALKIIACPEPRRRAAIEDPPVIVKILSHLGLPTHAPPRSPARRVDLFQMI
jgi:hypothetical protein